jgi:hypothetical protein
MANEFWLSDEQWLAIEPCMPTNQPGARRVDDRRVISGIIHVLKSEAAAGVTAHRSMGHTRRFIIAGTGGQDARYGGGYSRRCAMCRPEMSCTPSTARQPRPIARPLAEKGGAMPGDRAIAWRTHDQDPRRLRPSRTTNRPDDYPRPAWRCPRRTSTSCGLAAAAILRS